MIIFWFWDMKDLFKFFPYGLQDSYWIKVLILHHYLIITKLILKFRLSNHILKDIKALIISIVILIILLGKKLMFFKILLLSILFKFNTCLLILFLIKFLNLNERIWFRFLFDCLDIMMLIVYFMSLL